MSKPPLFEHDKPELLTEFLQDAQLYLETKSGLTAVMKRSMFIDCLDLTTKRNLRDLIAPATLVDGNVTFEVLVAKLKDKVSPAINKLVLYSNFVRRVQQEGESAAKFMAALRELSVGCGFGGFAPTMTMFQFVFGLRDRNLQAKVMIEHETITPTRALEIVEAGEQALSNVRVVRGEDTEEAVHVLRDGKPKFNKFKKDFKKNKVKPSERCCRRCGEAHFTNECTHAPKSLWCTKCKINGHILKVCNKAKREAASGTEEKQLHVEEAKSSKVKPRVENSDEEDDLYRIHVEPVTDEFVQPALLLNVDVNGFDVPFEVDCGAGRTIINRSTFHRMFPRNETTVFPAGVTLHAYNQSQAVSVLGKVYVQVKHKAYEGILPLIVTNGEGPNLIGRNWFRALGIRVEGINQLQETADEGESIAEAAHKQPAVTGVGTGCYKGPPLHLDPQITVMSWRSKCKTKWTN